jgi:3-hydroxybutyryl-CoA dehydratase
VTAEDVEASARVTGARTRCTSTRHRRQDPLGKRIAHGVLSAGFISAALGTKPDSVVVHLSQQLLFRLLVSLGDTITASVEVTVVDAEEGVVTVLTDCTNPGRRDRRQGRGDGAAGPGWGELT